MELRFLTWMEKLTHSKQSLTHWHQSCYHIETSQLICKANQLTGFYMIVNLAFSELIASLNCFTPLIAMKKICENNQNYAIWLNNNKWGWFTTNIIKDSLQKN